jgi:hypothetical protein
MEVLDNKKFKIFIKAVSVPWSQIFYRRDAQWVWRRDLKERDHLEHLDVDGRVILKWIFKKWMGTWTRLIWLSIGTADRGLVNAVMNLRVS